MFSEQKIKHCFIIGPMKNMNRLMYLRDEVVRPLLEPKGFTVSTPDSGDIGNVMRQVLLGLEQADILVADITGSNPNVMYELGVYHAFGKPYILLQEETKAVSATNTPFDIAEYRYHLLDFNNAAIAKTQLNPLLNSILDLEEEPDWFGNPVTDFYDSPIAEIPTAIGLFKNYRKNFIDVLLPSIFQKVNDQYAIPITEEVHQQGDTQNITWNNSTRDALIVKIIIPQKLNMTSHSYLSGLKTAGKIKFEKAAFQRPERPFGINYQVTPAGNKEITDIPTILSTLNESIVQRRKSQKRFFSNVDWEILEQQEIERFLSRCKKYIIDIEEKHPECIGRVKIERSLPVL